MAIMQEHHFETTSKFNSITSKPTYCLVSIIPFPKEYSRGLAIRFRAGARNIFLFQSVRPSRGPKYYPNQSVPSASSLSRVAGGVKLVTHPQTLPTLRMCGVTPPVPLRKVTTPEEKTLPFCIAVCRSLFKKKIIWVLNFVILRCVIPFVLVQ